MKRTITLLLTLVLLLSYGTFATAAAQEGTGLKLGFSVITSIDNSKDATADGDGLAQVDSTLVALLLDASDTIVDLYIDDVQAKMPFTAAGTLGASFPSEIKTKTELGADYGMSTVSKVGEWDAQIATLRTYMLGKTIAQVQGIAVDDATHPTDADLTAGCTMAIGDYIAAVVAAADSAQPVASAATDKVGVGIVVTTGSSKDAADGKDGLAQASGTYTAVTVNDSGVVTAALIDGTQGNVNFDATGKITSDTAAMVATKQQIGDAYGMRAASPIGKEWYEQADAFAAYVVGKTAAEIDGIALDEATKPTGADLTASVTISAGDFKSSVLKALANAQ
jgi:hypothetical protein